MNRIYKVIWSKVKHQYVVVSELAHRDGKRSSAASKSVRTLLAVLAVCGMTAFGLGTQDVYADGASTTQSQYIAIGDANRKDATGHSETGHWTGWPHFSEYVYDEYYRNIDNHTYVYTETDDGNFWVRKGYTIEVVHDDRYTGAGGPDKDIIINAYRGENADTAGLVQSYQNVQDSMNITTLNGDELFSTNTSMYGGAVNTSTTAVSTGNEFIINEGTQAISGTTSINLEGGASSYFQPVNYDSKTGLYHFGSINQSENIVNTENLYVINGTVGVFTKTPGGNRMDDIYTGDVYGRNNEILMTGVDANGNYVSYWGAEIVDPNAPIGSMSMSTLQGKFDEVENNIKKIHQDDIKEIQVAPTGTSTNGQGGTINLQTNGASEDGHPTGGEYIPGGITITSIGGTNGNDVQVQFSNTDPDTKQANSFTVNAGSKVVANPEEGTSQGTLNSVSINGEKYDLGGGKTYTEGNNINIDDNNVISTTKTTVSADNNFNVTPGPGTDEAKNITDYNIKLNNVVTVGSGEGSHPVKIDGKAGLVSGLTNTTWDADGDYSKSTNAATEAQLQTVSDEAGKHTTVEGGDHITVTQDEDTSNGLKYTISATGLADVDLSNISVTGTTKIENLAKGVEMHVNPTEYAVSDDGTVTMTYVDGNGNAVDGKTATITGIATNAAVTAAKTEVAAGTNVASVTKNDKTEDGHTVYTVNAKGTSVSGDKNVLVEAGEPDANNVTNYSVRLNDIVTIGSGEGSHPVKIDGVNGQVTGLTNTTLDVDGFGESNRAATEEQLKAVSDKVGEVSIEAEKHSTVTGDKENITVIPEEQADGHLNYEVTLHDNLYLGGENNAFVQVLGTAGKINLGGGNNIISIDGLLGQISGLSNVDWNYEDYVAGKYDTNLAATESQLHDAFGYLNDKINSIDIEGDDNITVDKSENTSGGSGSDSGSGSTGEESTGKGPHFDIGLKDDVTLGTTDEETGKVTNSGSLTIKDTSGNTITINQKDPETGKGNGLVSGLTNTDWDWNKYGKPADEGGYAGSTNAATESQINGALEGTVQYDKVKDEDGNVTVDKSHITLNEGGTTITNVAAGKNDMDAVNHSQLKNVQQQVTNNSLAINNIGSKVGELDSRIDKVGAGAAALAALHPLDFDPDDKWDFAAGYGNYRGESAVAIGAFYRPNEDTMFSVGGTVGNDDNMVNAGVSFKIGQGNGISTSRVAMAKEIKSMRDIVAKQDVQIQKLTAMVNALVGVQTETDTTTMFPDVPENHWAYEAVEAMAKSGLVKGYPDGEFKGDRTMTRYEFAQIVYNAIQAGAEVDARLVEEFKPELEYFHIATVAKDKDGNPTIERVRAN